MGTSSSIPTGASSSSHSELLKMDRDPDHKAWMSLRLSRVLDDIGINRQVVKKRREIFLLREAVETITKELLGLNHTCFHFGSQSEGSTTLGMNSDIDLLICRNDTNIMSDWADWEAGMENFLMVKEETTPPQHYCLQLIRRYSPEPVRYNGQEDCLPHIDGRVFASNKKFQHEVKLLLGNDFRCNGPSISISEEWDYVGAYKCKVLPPEVDRWFHRPRRGHWPTPEMMQDARECSCFLVADGHFESLNEIEWRLSPSQIERILVFSFTTVQLKCYVVLKMIKKYIMEQYLSHHSKLTSFHCKTVMFFTIERISPEEWREDRLIGCIGYCLQTLEFFLMKGYCPHYIIPEVNLFEGKITRRYQLLLLEKLKENLNNNLMILHDLQYDSLGQRFRSRTTDMFETRSTIFRKINNVLAGDLITLVYKRFLNVANIKLYPEQFQRFFTVLSIIPDNDYVIHILTLYERRAISLLKPIIYSFLASITSSFCLQHEVQFTPDIFQLYERSLDTDVTSSRLKLASMLFCQEDFRSAADVLNDVEFRYDDSVHAVCGCGRKIILGVEFPDLFSESTIYDWNYDTAIRKAALCVRFSRLEVFCVPHMLLYEMNRAVNDDVQHRDRIACNWMDMAVVDSRPYLFYLQYLTFGKLGLRLRQFQAHWNLTNCFRNQDMVDTMHHPESADNLLGHCYEMEGNLEMALQSYGRSLSNVPRNNAANWHMRRLIGNQLSV